MSDWQTLEPAETDQERPTSLDTIDRMIATSRNPSFVKTCIAFRDAYQPGHEVVEYRSSKASWEAMMGWHGFMLKRSGHVVASLTTKMN